MNKRICSDVIYLKEANKIFYDPLGLDLATHLTHIIVNYSLLDTSLHSSAIMVKHSLSQIPLAKFRSMCDNNNEH